MSELLQKEEGIKVQIVSAISEGLFRDQIEEYQDAILPVDVPTFGLTAGLPVTLRGLVPYGEIHGMESFGFSAPYEILDEKLCYTPQNVFDKVINLLEEEEEYYMENCDCDCNCSCHDEHSNCCDEKENCGCNDKK